MKSPSRLLGAVILALCVCLPPVADPSRSISIGVLNHPPGLYSDSAGEGSVTAAKMAAEGFMHDHPDFKVEIIAADHQNEADVGASITRRWIDQEGVEAIAAVPNSAVGLAATGVVRRTKVVVNAPSAASSDLTGKCCSSNTVQWMFDTLAASHTIGDFLQADGAGTEAIAFATAGGDTVNLIKRSTEFGLKRNGRSFAALLAATNDGESSGLARAQDLLITRPFDRVGVLTAIEAFRPLDERGCAAGAMAEQRLDAFGAGRIDVGTA